MRGRKVTATYTHHDPNLNFDPLLTVWLNLLKDTNSVWVSFSCYGWSEGVGRCYSLFVFTVAVRLYLSPFLSFLLCRSISGLSICGHNCLLTAEWMSASKIVCRVGPAKDDKGEIIVTTKSGGLGTSTVSFKLLKPERIGKAPNNSNLFNAYLARAVQSHCWGL